MNNLKYSWTEFLPDGPVSLTQRDQQTGPEDWTRGLDRRTVTGSKHSSGLRQSLRMTPALCLLLCWLVLPLRGLEIRNPEEVEYIRYNATATLGGSITLDCGSVVPDIYIWGFTRPGTDNNIAVAHNYGQGPKVQSQSSSVGRIQLQANSSALVLEEVQADAAGMYTCQALYDTDEGARITFYFARLTVEDN